MKPMKCSPMKKLAQNTTEAKLCLRTKEEEAEDIIRMHTNSSIGTFSKVVAFNNNNNNVVEANVSMFVMVEQRSLLLNQADQYQHGTANLSGDFDTKHCQARDIQSFITVRLRIPK